MLTKRVIPCLDVKDGRVVKGVNFVSLRDAGDPVLPGLKLQLTESETVLSSDSCEGAAWLSSARAVRCRLKCHNERNPYR